MEEVLNTSSTGRTSYNNLYIWQSPVLRSYLRKMSYSYDYRRKPNSCHLFLLPTTSPSCPHQLSLFYLIWAPSFNRTRTLWKQRHCAIWVCCFAGKGTLICVSVVQIFVLITQPTSCTHWTRQVRSDICITSHRLDNLTLGFYWEARCD